jgi:hypothetical protein
MLDGWMIDQSIKREEEQTKKQIAKETLNPRMAKADEILLVAKSVDDIKRIYDMNSPRAKMIVKDRLGQVKNQGEVNYKGFRDVKQRNLVRVNNAFRDRMRTKR